MEDEYFDRDSRLFHSLGAATAKAWTPVLTSLDKGTVKSNWFEDQDTSSYHKGRGVTKCTISLKALKT